MRIKNWIASIVAIGLTLVIVANLAGPTAWAASAVAPLGQTVPTRTPTAAPVTPTPTPEPLPPTEPATPAPSSVVSTPSPAGAPVLLPVAGSDSNGGLALVGAAGVCLLMLTWAARRRMARRPE